MDQFFVLGCFHEFVPSEIVSEKWMLIFVIVQFFTMLNTIFTNVFYKFLNNERYVKAMKATSCPCLKAYQKCDEFKNTSLNTYVYLTELR